MVGQGEPAHLECAVDANPLNKNTIRWERKGYDMASKTKTTMGSPTSTMLSTLNSNSVNSLFEDGGQQKNIGVVLLTVLNATADDSGEFWCMASNGLGSTSRNASFLLVRRKSYAYIYENVKCVLEVGSRSYKPSFQWSIVRKVGYERNTKTIFALQAGSFWFPLKNNCIWKPNAYERKQKWDKKETHQ